MSLQTNGTIFIVYCWMRPKLVIVLTTVLCFWCLGPVVLIMSLCGGFFSYLSGRHIRTKVSNRLSSSSSITSGVPQGLVQGPRSSISNLPQGYSICRFRSDCPLLLMISCCTFHPNSNLASAVHSKLTWMPYCLGPLIWMSPQFNALNFVDFCLGRHPSPDLQVDGVVIPWRLETHHLAIALSVDLRRNHPIEHLLSVTAGPIQICQKLACSASSPFLVIQHV